MKNIDTKIALILMLIVVFYILSSCGARQKQKKVTKEITATEKTTNENTQKQSETKVESESNLKKSEIVTVDNKNETVTEVETVEPADASKEAIYISPEGKKYNLNNSKYTKTKTTQKNNTQASTKSQEDATSKINLQVDFKELAEKKAIEKANGENYNSINNVKREAWSLWWLLIPIGIIAIILWAWKKYKKTTLL